MSQYRPKPPKNPDVRARMEAISAPLASKSKKIKALHEAGFTRSAIAGFLEIGYQHVRNVLTAAVPQKTRAAGVAETARAPYAAESETIESTGLFEIDSEGRIALSPPLLKAIDAKPGGRVPWRFEDGELKLMSLPAAWRQIDRLMGDLKRQPESLVDQLIAERRAEFEREELKFLSRQKKDE